ncbi:MAG: FecR domain-containing protein [Carboxylicivirga sp.]|jgi:ferric-dicitrate binding protein FerR (iron transport regulator)|nr:FecR domain-containing protein [Carboxylicivirga sp.]
MTEAEKIELLILRQLNSEISVEEEKDLTAWINRSDKNKATYQKQCEVFKAQSLIFSKERLAESREKTKTGVINQLMHQRSKVRSFVYTSLSVMLISLVVSTIWFNNNLSQRNKLLAGEFKVSAPQGSPANFELPDGTNVWLNSTSELRYKYDVNNSSRLASLEGEAFFDVAHDNDHPFLVQGYNHTVKVYGTEFNVISDRKKQVCEVTLKDGSVGIFDVNQKEVARLKPGQQFVVDKKGDYSIKKVDQADLISGWTTGRFEFKDATLEEIANKLASIYKVKIQIEDEALKNKRYRCVIQKEQSILTTLQRFSIITDLDYVVNDELIILKSK